MAYSIINQSKIDDILDSGFNLPISTDIMETCDIIGKCDSISLEELNNVGGTFYVIDKRNVVVKKCDLEANDNISIANPWCIEINDNTLRNITIEGLTTCAIIKNSYINRLNIYNCKTSDTITIQGTVIDELSIDTCLLKSGIYVSIDSTIKNIIVKDSIIDNTNIINNNAVNAMIMVATDEEQDNANNNDNNNDNNQRKHNINIESDIYEEVFEDIAIESFKMSRSLIINNNSNSAFGYVREAKKRINVREYIKKNDCMIAGYYTNKK